MRRACLDKTRPPRQGHLRAIALSKFQTGRLKDARRGSFPSDSSFSRVDFIPVFRGQKLALAAIDLPGARQERKNGRSKPTQVEYSLPNDLCPPLAN